MRNRLLLLALTSLFAVALAGTNVAFAQDDEEDPCSDPCSVDEDEGSTDEEGGETGAEDTQGSAGEGAAGAYPIAYLARPRVLPKGAWEAGLELGFNNDFSVIAVGNPNPFAPYQGGLSFMYSIDDKIDVGLSYAFTLKDFEAKGSLGVGGAYLVMADDTMQVRAEAMLGYSFILETLGPITAGGLVQYNLGDKMAVFARPALVVAPEIDLLGLGGIRPIYVNVPVSFGYQVSPEIFAEVGTNIAVIEISDAETGFLFADFIPVMAGGWYSLGNTIDVGANLAIDLKADEVGDSLTFGLMARYRDGV